MPIRLAHHSELDTVAAIFAAGFHDEEVVGDLLHPRRKQYPQDYVGFWRRRCRERWWQYSRVFLVSFEQEDGNGKGGREVLTGAAEWARVGLGWEKVWRVWGKWDPSKYILQGVNEWLLNYTITMFSCHACSIHLIVFYLSFFLFNRLDLVP
jgi:hypothetical protein